MPEFVQLTDCKPGPRYLQIWTRAADIRGLFLEQGSNGSVTGVLLATGERLHVAETPAEIMQMIQAANA